MNLLEILIATLATMEVLEIWHHSSLFAYWRSLGELLEGKVGTFYKCMFCMAPWVSWLVCMTLLGASNLLPFEVRWIVVSPLYALGVARLANLSNDLTHHWCRTPRANREI